VNFIRDPAYAIFEFPDDQRVNVFVGRAGEKIGLFPGLDANLFKGPLQFRPLAFRENARALQRPRKGHGTAAIDVNQLPIKMQRTGKALENLGRPAFEPSAPQLHLQQAQQQGLLNMQPILRLVENDRLRRIDHFIGDLFAALCRQTVQKHCVGVGLHE